MTLEFVSEACFSKQNSLDSCFGFSLVPLPGAVTSGFMVSMRCRWCCQFHQKCKQQKSLQSWGGYGKIKCTTGFLPLIYCSGIRVVTISRFPPLSWGGTKPGSYRQPRGERWEHRHRHTDTQIQAQTGCGTCILSAEAGLGVKAEGEVLKVQYVSVSHLIRTVGKKCLYWAARGCVFEPHNGRAENWMQFLICF